MRRLYPFVVLALFACAGAVDAPPPPVAVTTTAEVPPPQPPRQPAALEVRAQRMAERSFWNQPAAIAELGLQAADRQRLDALVLPILERVVAANRDQKEKIAAWADAVRAGDRDEIARRAAEFSDAAAALSRAQSEGKTELLAALGPEAAKRLANQYPRFLLVPWVRGNHLIDTSDLGKYLEEPIQTPRPRR